MIEIKTVQNNTGRGKNGFCFQSVADSEAGLEEIVNEMVDYNSTLTEADTKAALSVLDAVVKKLLQEGYKVRLPWVDLQLAARGSAEFCTSKFQDKKDDNCFVLKAAVNRKFEKSVTNDVSYRVEASGPVLTPVIFQVFPITEDAKPSSDCEIKRGKCFRILGRNLAFDFADEKQGVFLVLKNDRKKSFRIADFVRRTDRTIDGTVPYEAENGEYSVLFVKKVGDGTYLSSNMTNGICVVE